MKTGRSLTELAAEITRQSETKKDYVADLSAVTMVANDGVPELHVEGHGTNYGIRDTAHGQIAAHTKIDKRYYDRMKAEAPELLATNVDHWFRKHPAPQMLRMLDGNLRAMLSPGYRPLDNQEFAEAALPILLQRKLEIMSCEITEKRLYIKAVDTQLFRDVPIGHKMGDGTHTIFDTVAPAIILSNSEIGFGRLVVETGVYTRACTNMALFSNGGFKKTHLGTRHKLTDGFSVEELDKLLSAETKRKSLEALWLQVRDVIGSAFDEKVMRQRVEAIEVAAGRLITGDVPKVIEFVQDKFDLTKEEGGSILKHLIAGGSISQYGLHSAITRAAQDQADYDRATDLEYLGGRVLELPRTEWEVLAKAA